MKLIEAIFILLLTMVLALIAGVAVALSVLSKGVDAAAEILTEE